MVLVVVERAAEEELAVGVVAEWKDAAAERLLLEEVVKVVLESCFC